MSDLYHLGVAADCVPEDIIVVEGGIRSGTIASLLEGVAPAGARREFRSVLGTYANRPVLVTDAGIGGPSTVIAGEELISAGATRMIWVGHRRESAGAVAAPVLVPDAAVRRDGTSLQYAPLAFPAVSDVWLSQHLRAQLDLPLELALVETTDVLDDLPETAQDLCSAALFVLAAARRVAIASVLVSEDVIDLDASIARAVLDAVTGDGC